MQQCLGSVSPRSWYASASSRFRVLKALVSVSPQLELSTPRSRPRPQISRSRSRLGLLWTVSLAYLDVSVGNAVATSDGKQSTSSSSVSDCGRLTTHCTGCNSISSPLVLAAILHACVCSYIQALCQLNKLEDKNASSFFLHLQRNTGKKVNFHEKMIK